MIIRKLLKIQSNIEDRKVPCDMHDDELNQHYSESKGVFKNILDMDLIHLIRSYNKTLSHRDEYPNYDVYDCINDIENNLNIIENKISELRKLLWLTINLSHVNRIIRKDNIWNN